MQIQIEVLSVAAPQFIKTARGGYNSLEIAYKKDGKVEGKKLVDFTNKDVFNRLKEAKQGDVLTITSEKDAKDYWQWVGVLSGASAGPVAGNSTVDETPVRQSTGRVTGSNNETAEERAKKQRYIVRQSSITAALTQLIHNAGKGIVDENAVIQIARKYEDYVFGQGTSAQTASVQALSDLPDDIPL